MPLKIKVISPSSGVTGIEEILNQAKEKLLKENIELIYNENIFSNPELPYFSASFDIRQNDLLEAIKSNDYYIIWTTRGGYGASNLIDKCLQLLPAKNKTFIGFSDATALHILFNQHYKLPTIHGEVLIYALENKNDFSAIMELLTGHSKSYELAPFHNITNKHIEGELVGGNLTVITTLIGTKLNPNFAGKILLLEDVNEKGYHVHRHLMHLKQAGNLEGIKAIIFGDFTKSDEHLLPSLEYFCKKEVSCPCYRIEDIGHGENNKPIILGTNAIIANSKLEVLSPFKYKF